MGDGEGRVTEVQRGGEWGRRGRAEDGRGRWREME